MTDTKVTGAPLSALLVDPSLFTPAYDAALNGGLSGAGVATTWAGRPLWRGEVGELPPASILPIFYRHIRGTVKGAGLVRKIRKALSHLAGALTVLRIGRRYDVVHYQWAVVPMVDAVVMRGLTRTVPVVLTLHDSTPFNGTPTSRWQTVGFDRACRAASRIIVHTASARDNLIARGYDPSRVVHIAHGPLAIPGLGDVGRSAPDKRPWVFVLFGRLQPYKGVDVIVEAIGRLPRDVSKLCKVVIAGEAQMALDPILERVAALNLSEIFEFRPKRLSEPEMAALFHEADCFVFPYRSIEASGVLFLVYKLGKWMVASDLGSFRDLIVEGETGELVAPGDAEELAGALERAIGAVPAEAVIPGAPDWPEIGLKTRRLYEEVIAARSAASG